MLKKGDRIISRVKSRYCRTSHKFGISLPHSVEEAYTIDEGNGNNIWRDTIGKELKKILDMETFEIMEGVKPKNIRYQKHHMPGYKEIGYNIIFGINMEGKFKVSTKIKAGCEWS